MNPFKLIGLMLFFFKEVVLSNIKVARDALSPRPKIAPGFVTVQLGELSERQLFVLANMVTMTPGTLSLEVSPDRDTLLLHTLYSSDPDSIQADITDNYERRIRHAL